MKQSEHLSLSGKVAVVTGASRGVGKGIAMALGEAGATVYVTGRTLKSGEASVPLPGTLTGTAREVTRLGGKGIPRKCDHREDDEVREVFDAIYSDQGRVDILVNNAWAGYEHLHRDQYYTGPFWEQPVELWDAMQNVGLRSSFVATTYMAPYVVKQKDGLIVNISYYSTSYKGSNTRTYRIAKLATDKLAVELARDLKKFGVACVSLYPGHVRTEGVMKGIPEDKLPYTESPMYVGRAVAALAADPRRMKKTGKILLAGEMAKEYGFKDIDGTCPSPTDTVKIGKQFNRTAFERLRRAIE
jgi:dehydrogenase/reductase SDR family protein 1